jgi:RNA polymerase sigma-70 factor (ECF subfamily)
MTTTSRPLGAGTTDERLMEFAQQGDPAAFGMLVHRYTTLVEHTARRIVTGAAEDVAQQTFISAWLGRHRFDAGRGSVRSWLCGIAHHRAIDHHRREARRVTSTSSLDDSANVLVCPDAGPAQIAERRAGAAEMRAAVGRLGVQQRTVIALAYYGGLSQTEIQHATQAPLGTVKGRTRLALAALRTQLPAAA